MRTYLFLAGEMIAWSVLPLISHRSKYTSPEDRRKKGKEERIRDFEGYLDFKEALDRLAALSEPQAGS